MRIEHDHKNRLLLVMPEGVSPGRPRPADLQRPQQSAVRTIVALLFALFTAPFAGA